MKKPLLLIALVVLVGCNTPSRDFRGLEAVRITVGQSTFDVRVNGNRAEALRINSEYALRLEAVAPRAFVAIEKVSGCKVRRLGGDQILIHASLQCGKNSNPPPPLPRSIRYDCVVDDIRGIGQTAPEIRCQPIN